MLRYFCDGFTNDAELLFFTFHDVNSKEQFQVEVSCIVPKGCEVPCAERHIGGIMDTSAIALSSARNICE